jgi:F-type H+-transporting ATPase subunit a
MFLLNLLQQHGQEAAPAAAQHATEAAHGTAQAAGHAAEAAGHGAAAAHHGEHVPVIVEKLNDMIGPALFNLQSQIMPPIYKALKVFGAHWPGEGLTYEQYRAAGELPLPTHIVMFLFAILVSVVVLSLLRGKLSTENPSNKQQGFEVLVEGIRSLLSDLVGPGGMKHFPVVATFGLLIFVSNLTGMLPDMVSPTANFNVTLALALSSFIYYNYVGIRENGLFGHLKHFCGPVLWLAPLMFPIEIISNLARIMSLSMRLFGNIYGEEQVSGAIAQMVQWIVPALLMPLGLLTSFLQTFIFIVLSMVYLGEVSHHHDEHHADDHHQDDHHGEIAHGHAAAAH